MEPLAVLTYGAEQKAITLELLRYHREIFMGARYDQNHGRTSSTVAAS